MRRKIWIPEAPMLNMRHYKEICGVSNMVGVAGYFTVDLIHAASGLVARHLEFKNLIPDAGLEAAGTTKIPGTLNQYCAVGTGSTAPAVDQTQLVAELARTNSTGSVLDVNSQDIAALGYCFVRVSRNFTTAQANGNLTEIGFFNAATDGTMLCRQLFLDEEGVPTTITKTSEFQLRITYEFRVYPSIADLVYSATINGSAMNITRRPGAGWDLRNATSSGQPVSGGFGASTASWEGGTAYSGTLGAVGSKPGGSLGNRTSTTEAAYVPLSFQREATHEWDSTAGNGLIKTIILAGRAEGLASGNWTYQHQLTTALNKSNTQKLVVQYTRSWSRYTP